MKKAKGICGKVWQHAWDGMAPCRLSTGHKAGCEFRTNKSEQEPDVLDRLTNALAEATACLNTLRKRGLDCE